MIQKKKNVCAFSFNKICESVIRKKKQMTNMILFCNSIYIRAPPSHHLGSLVLYFYTHIQQKKQLLYKKKKTPPTNPKT